MIRTLILISIILLFTLGCPFTSFANEEKTNDQLTQSALKIALSPYIVEAISNYQKKTQTYAPFSMNFNLFQTKIHDVKKTNHRNAYLVKMQLNTFEHAHNPPHFEVLITIEVSPFENKVENFQIRKDEKAKKIGKFYQNAISDITQSFSLDLKNYRVYNSVIVPNGLKNTVTDIIKNILNPTIKPPYKNVIDPVTFLKGNKGYILFKQSNGTNVVYTIKKDGDQWRIIDKRTKPGEKMEEELLWYM